MFAIVCGKEVCTGLLAKVEIVIYWRENPVRLGKRIGKAETKSRRRTGRT